MFDETSKRLRLIKCVGAVLLALLASPAQAAGADLALGEYLSGECVTCHQISGKAAAGIPPIAGLARDVFVTALMAYKTGQRANDVMRSIAARLTAEEMEALAAYFAAHKP